MSPKERLRSAVAEDMLSAADSISFSALAPCWLAILSILPATANWVFPNVPAAFRFSAAEIESIEAMMLPARSPCYPPRKKYDTGRAAGQRNVRIRRITIGRSILDGITLGRNAPCRTHTKHGTVGFLGDRCRKHHMLRSGGGIRKACVASEKLALERPEFLG